MGYSQYDPASQGRAAWNAGKTVGTKDVFVTVLFSIWRSIASYVAATW
jgi:hypothetical protein